MRRLVAFVVWLSLLVWSAPTYASEGPTTALEHRVNTGGLGGADLFLANLYNDRRVMYAVVCTAMMGLCGMAIGFVVDALLAGLGLKVTKQGHRE
jgi:predicted permease